MKRWTYGNPGSCFLRTVTGKESGGDISEKSKMIMTFWNNLRVTGILWSFMIVMHGKPDKGIPESSRLKFL